MLRKIVSSCCTEPQATAAVSPSAAISSGGKSYHSVPLCNRLSQLCKSHLTCRQPTEDSPRTEGHISSRTGVLVSELSTGVTPGAARADGARSSVHVSKVSSESTRRHGRPTPRPTTSKATFPKRPGTYSRQQAGQILALYLT